MISFTEYMKDPKFPPAVIILIDYSTWPTNVFDILSFMLAAQGLTQPSSLTLDLDGLGKKEFLFIVLNDWN